MIFSAEHFRAAIGYPWRTRADLVRSFGYAPDPEDLVALGMIMAVNSTAYRGGLQFAADSIVAATAEDAQGPAK